MQLDFDDPYSIFLYGTGVLVALWISSAVVRAIDSIPVVCSLLTFMNLFKV